MKLVEIESGQINILGLRCVLQSVQPIHAAPSKISRNLGTFACREEFTQTLVAKALNHASDPQCSV